MDRSSAAEGVNDELFQQIAGAHNLAADEIDIFALTMS
jgi:hypothetical protein